MYRRLASVAFMQEYGDGFGITDLHVMSLVTFVF